VELKIPISVVTQGDVNRLLRELSNVEGFFISAAARKPGTPMQPPKMTKTLEEMAAQNGYSLLDAKARQQLKAGLENILARAPLLHISFAADPPPRALEQILVWLRQNIDPRLLLQIGLQPTIAAGCVVRTPNHIFDMSLREYLKKQQPYLVKLIQGAAGGGH